MTDRTGSKKRYKFNKKHVRILFGRMQWAMLLFLVMIGVLLAERRNIIYSSTERSPIILEQTVFNETPLEKEAECLLLWDSSSSVSVLAHQQMDDVLGLSLIHICFFLSVKDVS